MAKAILTATWTHARNLGLFVPLYKFILLILKRVKGEHKSDAFIAGLVGGYIIFGKDSNINHQIVLYLFSRVCIASAKLIYTKNKWTAPQGSFSFFSALTWGIGVLI